MSDLRGAAFNRVRSDEVPFNYQFGALLGYSLTVGSALAEEIHPGIEFEEQTELVALQTFSELDDELEHGPREIDIALQDSQTLVGIESKRESTLKASQLRQEVQVLEQNADGRDIILLVVTEDTEAPSAVANANSTTEHPVLWNSWHRIALQFEEQRFAEKYDPIRHMVIDLFEDTEYTLSFDGFPEPALDSSVYIQWLQQFTNLMYDLETVLQHEPIYLNRSNGQNMPSFASKNTSSNYLEKSWWQPAAPVLFVPFTLDANESINKYGKDAHMSLYGNYHDNELGVFLDLNPRNDGWSEKVLKENRHEITNRILEQEMFLRVSRNSHAHSNRKPQDLRTRDSILEFIESTAGTKDGKRVLIGRFLSESESPEETVEAFATELKFFYEEFFQNDKILGKYRTD